MKYSDTRSRKCSSVVAHAHGSVQLEAYIEDFKSHEKHSGYEVDVHSMGANEYELCDHCYSSRALQTTIMSKRAAEPGIKQIFAAMLTIKATTIFTVQVRRAESLRRGSWQTPPNAGKTNIKLKRDPATYRKTKILYIEQGICKANDERRCRLKSSSSRCEDRGKQHRWASQKMCAVLVVGQLMVLRDRDDDP